MRMLLLEELISKKSNKLNIFVGRLIELLPER